jgi:predicted nucleic acid-binding Zn ribbon protein
MISGYYCNRCGGGADYLQLLQTGSLFSTPKQSGSFKKHTLGSLTSATNGVFFNSETGFYESGARNIGHLGFVEIESSGYVNAYFDFGAPIGEIQWSGTASGDSSLGKAVLLNYPAVFHWFPATGYGSNTGVCETCGRRLF